MLVCFSKGVGNFWERGRGLLEYFRKRVGGCLGMGSGLLGSLGYFRGCWYILKKGSGLFGEICHLIGKREFSKNYYYGSSVKLRMTILLIPLSSRR